MILISILILSVLVFVHELGHFLVAKYFRVGVLEFAIGFGPKLWRRRYGDTWYSVRAIPLGGYVRMVGDTPYGVAEHKVEELEHEKSEASQEATSDSMPEMDEVERRLWDDRSRWFLTQPVFPRILIVLAGPFFNIAFAFLLAVGTFYVYGIHKVIDEAVIGEVVPDYPADKAGVKRGDRVLSVGGETVETWMEMSAKIAAGQGEPVSLAIERLDESGHATPLTVTVNPQLDTPEMELLGGGSSKKRYKIGIFQSTERTPATFGHSLYAGATYTWRLCALTVKSLYGMIKGIISPEHIAGPIFIFKEAAKSAKKGIESVFDFMIFLSISLGVLNLLPIPILDGGHITFFLIESIRRKPVSIRFQEYANQFGMVVLLLLMLFALGNDIRRLFI